MDDMPSDESSNSTDALHSGVKMTLVVNVTVSDGWMTKWPREGRVKGVQC